MALFQRMSPLSLRLLQTRCITLSSSTMGYDRAGKEMQQFWKKNVDLKRPMSPHLTIYKPQLTSMLSITHRITGCVLTGAMYMGPLIYLNGTHDYAGYLAMVQSWGLPGIALIKLTKFGLAFSFSFHFVNAFRHLAWDYAVGFGLGHVYMSGVIIMGLTLLMTYLLLNLDKPIMPAKKPAH